MEYIFARYDDELYHYGVKGMKWGVRRALNNVKDYHANKKAIKDSYRNDGSPKRGLVNAANSAARTYYRKERTGNFKTYRTQSNKLELKTARLTDEQVKNGRYRVARARNIRRKTLSTITGTAAGLALVSSGAGIVGLAIGTGVGIGTNFASGGRYYAKQKRAYGGARAKYEIKTEKNKNKRIVDNQR